MGFLYAPGDVGGLAEGLQRWIDDPSALCRTREAARHAAETRFNWEKESVVFLQCIEKALKDAKENHG